MRPSGTPGRRLYRSMTCCTSPPSLLASSPELCSCGARWWWRRRRLSSAHVRDTVCILACCCLHALPRTPRLDSRQPTADSAGLTHMSGHAPSLRRTSARPLCRTACLPAHTHAASSAAVPLRRVHECVRDTHGLHACMYAGPADMMAHEMQKLITQDRVLPGAFADAMQLALASGIAGPDLQLPILEVAGAIDDRRLLQGDPNLKRPIAAGCAHSPPLPCTPPASCHRSSPRHLLRLPSPSLPACSSHTHDHTVNGPPRAACRSPKRTASRPGRQSLLRRARATGSCRCSLVPGPQAATLHAAAGVG